MQMLQCRFCEKIKTLNIKVFYKVFTRVFKPFSCKQAWMETEWKHVCLSVSLV